MVIIVITQEFFKHEICLMTSAVIVIIVIWTGKKFDNIETSAILKPPFAFNIDNFVLIINRPLVIFVVFDNFNKSLVNRRSRANHRHTHSDSARYDDRDLLCAICCIATLSFAILTGSISVLSVFMERFHPGY